MKHEHRDIRKTIAIAGIAAMIMFSFTFTLAPLYNTLCRNTGFNGKLNLTPLRQTPNQLPAPDLTRQLTVQFVTTNNANLPWQFYPEKTSIPIHPDETIKTFFYAKNNTSHTITVQAIPSITPWQAARHFHKIECFCFKQQTLKGGESLKMPVVFRVDRDISTQIKTITLAYTLFQVKK